MQKYTLPIPFPKRTPLTNLTALAQGSLELQFLMSDEIMHGSDDVSYSLEIEHKKTTSQGGIGFSTKQHSETSHSHSNTEKVTMTSAKLQVLDENKAF